MVDENKKEEKDKVEIPGKSQAEIDARKKER